MAIRKRTASITCDAGGNGSDDILISGYSADGPSRFIGLHGVEVVTPTTATGMNTRRVHVEVLELDPDADDSTDLYPGELLFHVGSARDGVYYQPREESVSRSVGHGATYPTGQTTGEENVLPRIRTNRVRVDITGATPSSVVTVDVFVETAGDQRF